MQLSLALLQVTQANSEKFEFDLELANIEHREEVTTYSYENRLHA
jgi:hypothetical protein